MVFIDPNMTYSPQFCDIAVGALVGAGSTMYLLGRLLIILLGFYMIYRVTKIFIDRKKEATTK